MTIWCEGKNKKRMHRVSDSLGSDNESNSTKKKKGPCSDDRISRVDDVVDNLREKHGHAFSSLQYRVWAETIMEGRHVSMDNPPRGSYFKKSNLRLHEHSPVNSDKQNVPTVITPVKTAELKTMYISQIKELYSLLEIGALTDSDFQKQKSKIDG